jgi:hypothetical protein
VGLSGDSDQRHGPAVTKQSQVSVKTVRHRYSIYDEIELAYMSIHLFGVPCYHNLLGA